MCASPAPGELTLYTLQPRECYAVTLPYRNFSPLGPRIAIVAPVTVFKNRNLVYDNDGQM